MPSRPALPTLNDMLRVCALLLAVCLFPAAAAADATNDIDAALESWLAKIDSSDQRISSEGVLESI